jgi:rhodanese-related sulfurtransferase
MKIRHIFALVMVSIFVKGFAMAATEIETLTPQQVQQEIKSGDVLVLDANPESIYKKHHVPNSKNIKFNEFSNSLPANKNKRLIFYCMNEMCSASHQAAEFAVKAGYKNVARMPSGINGWLKAQLPAESNHLRE